MASANRSNPYQPVPTGGALDVFDRLFDSTPLYRGDGQPRPQRGGLLAIFGGLLGTPTPAYRAAPAGDTEDESSPSDSCTDSEPVTLTGGDGAPVTIVITRD
jgi:hypothetical protein